MNTILSDRRDDCVQIRLASGDTNVLTTDMLCTLSAALGEAERGARGVLLCGGEKCFSNGVDLEWALTQSRAEMAYTGFSCKKLPGMIVG